jgi:formylglycine-generating enzyme required for sulfatase activity
MVNGDVVCDFAMIRDSVVSWGNLWSRFAGVMKRATIPLAASIAFVSLGVIVHAQDAAAPVSFRDCPDCPEMVVVPPGQFLMGSSDEDTKRDFAAIPKAAGFRALFFTDRGIAKWYLPYEHPQHQVSIPLPFTMSRYPITRDEFAAFVRETHYETEPCWLRGHPGRQPPPQSSAWMHPGFDQSDRDPVVCVGWKDAQAYIRWLNQRVTHDGTDGSAGPYRLPSEAEWEYAARAGTQSARWWGDDIGYDHALCDGCNTPPCPEPKMVNGRIVYPCANMPVAKPIRHTLPVGSFPANPFGLYDILGNVAVITEDCWHDSYMGAPTDGSAWKDGSCRYRSGRGGSWLAAAWAVRSTTRTHAGIDETSNDSGFRIVRSAH